MTTIDNRKAATYTYPDEPVDLPRLESLEREVADLKLRLELLSELVMNQSRIMSDMPIQMPLPNFGEMKFS